MSRSVLDGEYRAAIALNNLAVSLQRKGRKQEAVETFRFALAAIKIASRQNRTADEKRDVEEKVQLASRRFMTSTPTMGEEMIDIVSDDLHLGRLLDSPKNDILSGRTLVRIEEYGDDGPSDRNLDLDASIILHNYGISILVFGVKGSRTASREYSQCHTDGIQLLTLSYQVVSAFALESAEDALLHKALLIATVVTRSMAQTFHSLNIAWKVEECLEHLNVIGELANSSSLGYSFIAFGDVAPAA